MTNEELRMEIINNTERGIKAKADLEKCLNMKMEDMNETQILVGLAMVAYAENWASQKGGN